jgi:hypothetical protein
LPWAELYWPFRPKENTNRDLCIKSSFSKKGAKSACGRGVSI